WPIPSRRIGPRKILVPLRPDLSHIAVRTERSPPVTLRPAGRISLFWAMGYRLHKPGIVRAIRRRRRGFTLLELLVVVGIIAVLLALLLPALNRARRQARSVACLANLHQLGIAFQSYFQQNRGRPPCLYGNLDTTEQVWVPLLRREMNGSHKALLCPEAAEPTGVPQYDWGSWEIGTAHHAWIWQVTTVAVGSGVPWAWDGGSYGMNAWLLTIPPDVEVPPQSPRDAYITTPARDSAR